jgi:hypothetical protein
MNNIEKNSKLKQLFSQRYDMAAKQKFSIKLVPSRKPDISSDPDQLKAEIEKRAKEIFLNRQKSQMSGDELSDWLLAEKEIRSKVLTY